MKATRWALALTMVWGATGCDDDPGQTHLQYMPDMVASVPYDAFSPNPNTVDGRTLQKPVEGTVARGSTPLHFEAGPAEAARAASTLTNPWPDDADTRARGAVAFARYCSHCHGPAGQGDGLVAQRFPRPPPLDAPHARGLSDGQIFHIITFGQGLMPAHGSQVQPDDRWKLVIHLRSLQGASLPAAQGAP